MSVRATTWASTLANRVVGVGPLRLLTAGLFDAGLSSLAGFSVALYAARNLEPGVFGAYALYFSAFTLAGFIPATLYLLPSRVASLEFDVSQRVGILPRTLLTGALFSGLTAIFVPFIGIIVLGRLPFATLMPLAITSVAVVLLSPLQDHLRSTLHLSGRSQTAVLVSVVQFVVVLTSLICMSAVGLAAAWIPFGALGLANFCSLLIGWERVREDVRDSRTALAPLRALILTGRHQLAVSIIPCATQLFAAALVGALVSADALGYAEAARIVAQPIHVFAIGIAQVTTPRSLEAGRSRSRPRALVARRLFMIPLVACCLVYVPIGGWSYPINPIEKLLPIAFHISGLPIISLAAIFSLNSVTPCFGELLGANQGHRLVLPAVIGSFVHLLVTGLLIFTLGNYVIPIAFLAGSLATSILTCFRAEQMWANQDHDHV